MLCLGQILFLGPADNRQPGFLKGEFLDHLAALPPWHRTTWYCREIDLRRSRDGQPPTIEEMRLWTPSLAAEPGHLSSRSAPSANAYRLDRFEIVIAPIVAIRWRTPGSHGRMRSGPGALLENILFLGPEGDPADLDPVSKKQFRNRWQALPRWDGTAYYTHRFTLYACRDGHLWEGWKAAPSRSPPTSGCPPCAGPDRPAKAPPNRSPRVTRPLGRGVSGLICRTLARAKRWLQAVAPGGPIKKPLAVVAGLLIAAEVIIAGIWDLMAGHEHEWRHHRSSELGIRHRRRPARLLDRVRQWKKKS